MSELKPCLLCEGEAKLLRRSGRAGIACPSKWYRERVECKVCGLTTREYKRPGSAFRSWNKRPRPTPVPCDELETVAYQYKFRDVWLVSDAPKVMRKDDYELRELVTRQNAEAVIAAKDARITELEADNKRLREALDMSEAAISEYYRYRYGGELRGSYDGKPEREGLWKAMYKARAALGDVKP